MNSLLRLTACASFLGLFFVGAYAVCPVVLEDAGLDLTEWIRCQRTFDSETDRGEELTRQQQFALERMKAKNQIARDLIAGRLTLAEAVARFGDLPHPPQRMWELLRLYSDGGGSDEAIMGRHVIDWACQLLVNEPTREEAVRLRLENELRAHRQ